MYKITDGNAAERIADWDTVIATLESWSGNLDLQADEGDIETLRKELTGTGYRVEEVA